MWVKFSTISRISSALSAKTSSPSSIVVTSIRRLLNSDAGMPRSSGIRRCRIRMLFFGGERQHAAVVPDHGDRRLGDLHRPIDVFRPADFERSRLRVDQAILVETQIGLWPPGCAAPSGRSAASSSTPSSTPRMSDCRATRRSGGIRITSAPARTASTVASPIQAEPTPSMSMASVTMRPSKAHFVAQDLLIEARRRGSRDGRTDRGPAPPCGRP